MAFDEKVAIESSCGIESDGVIVVSTAFLENYFGVSRPAIQKWTQQGCPKLERGKWDLIAVLKWRGWVSGVDGEGEGQGLHVKKLKAETFLKEMQGELAELELQRVKGELISLAEVEDVIGAAIINAKAQLLSLPAKIAPKLMGVDLPTQLAQAMAEHSEALVKAGSKKAVMAAIKRAIADFHQAGTLVEINDMVSRMVHEILDELAKAEVEPGTGRR